MKFSMTSGRIGGFLACLYIEATHAFLQPETNTDPLVSVAVEEYLVKPCSCDCCRVVERPKFEVQAFDDGTVLDKKCVPPEENVVQRGDDVQDSEKCPSECKADNADRVLTAAVDGNLDTSRYCEYLCKPAIDMVGGVCIQLTEKEVAEHMDETGNGAEGAKIMAPANPAVDFAGPAAGSGGPAAKAKAPDAPEDQADADNGAHVRWDLRRVIAQRLRAEAGAEMARSAATEQRVHADTYIVEKDKEMARYVQKVLTPEEGKGQEAQVGTRSEADAAAIFTTTANRRLREAQVVSQTVVEETKKIVKAEIMKQAKAAAKQEAEADSYMQAWDKPDNWGKTLAVKAAAPYLTEMVNAITRTSEYDGFSRGLLAQAKSAQNQAQDLILHANQMKAQGDLLGYATEEKKVTLLIGKARSLEEEANKFWKIADETRKTIPEWQQGGNMAAARAAWEFKVSFTPAPDSFL
jgi:hypothetical protein